jgi:hypothetical protein
MSGELWKPPTGISLLRMRRQEKAIRDGHGRVVGRVYIDDSGRVRQVESDNRLDAQVMPTTIERSLAPKGPGG